MVSSSFLVSNPIYNLIMLDNRHIFHINFTSLSNITKNYIKLKHTYMLICTYYIHNNILCSDDVAS